MLYNSCGFEKTKFDRKEQDTHTYPVCNEPNEDRNHMFTCKVPTAVKSVGGPQYITNVKENDHWKHQTRP